MAEIVATNVVASRPPNGDRLQRRPLVPITAEIVATTSLPVGHLTATDCNTAARAKNTHQDKENASYIQMKFKKHIDHLKPSVPSDC